MLCRKHMLVSVSRGLKAYKQHVPLTIPLLRFLKSVFFVFFIRLFHTSLRNYCVKKLCLRLCWIVTGWKLTDWLCYCEVAVLLTVNISVLIADRCYTDIDVLFHNCFKMLRFGLWLYTVPLSEQIAACAWSLELPSSYKTHSIFILQEHLSLCYRGMKLTGLTTSMHIAHYTTGSLIKVCYIQHANCFFGCLTKYFTNNTIYFLYSK